jgi:uncharacterized protein (TIRG00374 family)
MRKKLSFLLPFVGLTLFALIVLKTGPERIGSVIANADPRLVVWSPAFVAAVIVLRGVRWRLLMRVVGIDFPLRRCTTVWMIGFFAASVTPAKAGDAIRALYVKNDTGRNFGESFLTVFVDRLLDLALILVLGVVSVLLFSRYYMRLPAHWVLVLAAAGIAAAVALVSNRRLMRLMLKPLFEALVPQPYKQRFSLNFHTFYDSLARYGRTPAIMWVAMLLTVAAWAVVFALAWYLTVAFGIDVAPPFVFLVMPIITLVELIPISVSGLGTRDATLIYLFSMVGVSSAAAVSFSIGYVLVGTYLTAAAGFLLWLRHPVKWGAS